jgi:hypothetical protein
MQRQGMARMPGEQGAAGRCAAGTCGEGLSVQPQLQHFTIAAAVQPTHMVRGHQCVACGRSLPCGCSACRALTSLLVQAQQLEELVTGHCGHGQQGRAADVVRKRHGRHKHHQLQRNKWLMSGRRHRRACLLPGRQAGAGRGLLLLAGRVPPLPAAAMLAVWPCVGASCAPLSPLVLRCAAAHAWRRLPSGPPAAHLHLLGEGPVGAERR